MKTVILAGGLGTRFGHETNSRSKAMLSIGGVPILAHIMRTFMRQGQREFVVAAGVQVQSLVAYFSRTNDLCEHPRVEHATDVVTVTTPEQPGLEISFVDTGAGTSSAGRLARLRPLLDGNAFFLAWCDGLADVDYTRLLDYHRAHGRAATVVAIRPPVRFGRLTLDGDRVAAFEEKPDAAKEWINGGFFVLEAAAMDFIEAESEMFEGGPLPRMAAAGELMAYRHHGFWDCMDTPADRQRLEDLWRSGQAPWAGPEAAA